MPPRSRILVQRISSLDLPILPFLAPRVFKPWPHFIRKSHSTSQELNPDASFHGRADEYSYQPSDGNNAKPPQGVRDEEFQRRFKEIWSSDHTEQISSEAAETQPRKGTDNTSSTDWKGVLNTNRLQTTRVKIDGQKLSKDRTVQKQSHISTKKQFGRRLPTTRPKFVRLTPSITSTESRFSNFWNKSFALLHLRHYRFLRNRRFPRFRIALRKEESQRLRRELLEDSSTISSISKIWETVSLADRSKVWPELLLAALSQNPDAALKLLRAINSPPYLPSYAVSDTLDFISCHYLRSKRSIDADKLRSIFDAVMDLVRKGPQGYLELTQNMIYLLLSSLDAASCQKFYLKLVEINHPLHKNTLMQFASRLGHFGEVDLAFKAMQRLREMGADFNSPQMASICTTLLHHESWETHSSTAKPMVSESSLFEFMLQSGFKPNIITFNVLIQNALRIWDYETAWRVHDMMAENGVDADGFTYSILLNDAKLYQDEQTIQSVLELVRKKGLQNAHITTDFLHAIFLLHPGRYLRPSTRYVATATTKQAPDAWDEMCPIYCKYFKIEPLLHLIPSSLSYRDILTSSASAVVDDANSPIIAKDDKIGGTDLKDPSIPTLFVMLVGLLNSFTKPRDSKLFYEHFQGLVAAGDPAVAGFMETPHIYNIILLALGQFSENTSMCSRLIGDMLPPKTLVSGSEDASISSDSQGKMMKIPKPDIYTWSILLKVFIDSQQARAAEKVLSLMQSHNITPNHVTWKSLVSGYARMNDPIMVAKTLSRLQDAGIESEEITKKALELTKDHTALIATMRAERPKRSARKGKILRQTFEVLDRAAEVMEDDQKEASTPAEPAEAKDSKEPIVR
ncbi:hypothetical protein F5884DRAFT_827349 [Xylogone sp. PMI_703]|nr:hypothetical protein F5884DRAFT_827349 [Xylogone sp. PMI_703]